MIEVNRNKGNKRLLKIGLVLALLITLVTNKGSIVSASAPITVLVDASLVKFTVQPYISDGTTLVQFRPIFEKLGLEITWDNEKHQITGTKENLTITLTIGSKKATVNGVSIDLAKAPIITNGNTIIPLRFVGEAVGSIVNFDKAANQITIDKPALENPEELTPILEPEPTPSIGQEPEQAPILSSNLEKDLGISISLSPEQSKQVDDSAKKIISEIITPSMTDLEKEKAIYDYIVIHVIYDQKFYNEHIATETSPGSAYGALIEGYAVCAGYADAMVVKQHDVY